MSSSGTGSRRIRTVRVGLPLAVPTIVVLVAVRLRPDATRDMVRRLNKHVLNPAMLKLAGRRHWYAAAIHHRGRRSGREYVTPVMAQPVDGGFVVPLPYGTTVDWLRNVLAAGRATIDHQGRHYPVIEPEIIEATAASPLLPTRLQRTWHRFGIQRFLRVSIADGADDEQRQDAREPVVPMPST